MQPLDEASGFSKTVKTLVVDNTYMFNASVQINPVRERINASLAELNGLEAIRGDF